MLAGGHVLEKLCQLAKAIAIDAKGLAMGWIPGTVKADTVSPTTTTGSFLGAVLPKR